MLAQPLLERRKTAARVVGLAGLVVLAAEDHIVVAGMLVDAQIVVRAGSSSPSRAFAEPSLSRRVRARRRSSTETGPSAATSTARRRRPTSAAHAWRRPGNRRQWCGSRTAPAADGRRISSTFVSSNTKHPSPGMRSTSAARYFVGMKSRLALVAHGRAAEGSAPRPRTSRRNRAGLRDFGFTAAIDPRLFEIGCDAEAKRYPGPRRSRTRCARDSTIS